MAGTKSRFATDDDYFFFNNGTFCKILIYFDCLFEGEWNLKNPVLTDDIQEAFKELDEMGYGLYLIEVPVSSSIIFSITKIRLVSDLSQKILSIL